MLGVYFQVSWSSIDSLTVPQVSCFPDGSPDHISSFFEADGKNEAAATAGSPCILSAFQIWFRVLRTNLVVGLRAKMWESGLVSTVFAVLQQH